MIRRAVIRNISIVADKLRLNINIIELEDGVETIFAVYKCISQGIVISMILSDETMNFLSGSKSSEITKTYLKIRIFP